VGYHSTMRFTRSRAVLTLLLAVTLASAPVRGDGLPELGDVAGGDLPLSAEKKIGQQIMHEIRWQSPSYLDDPDVEAYLNQLGGRLSAVSSDPGFGFQFFAIDEPSINAFAMPGGYIGVHAGLILAAQSESELAGVLAHEISHVTQRHIARQVYQSKQVGIASMVAMGLALLAARSNSQVAGAAIVGSQAGAMSAQLAFSRDFERESDRLGFDTLQRAGFDVRGMGRFFERLQQAVRLYENNATAYLRTHPLTGERLSDMQNREQAYPYRQVRDSNDFLLVRARVRALQGRPADAVKELQRQLAEEKFNSRPAIQYGLAVALARQRDWSAAEQALAPVQATGLSSALLEHLAADLRLAQGDLKQGLRLYSEGLLRFPQHPGLVYGYAAALIEARRFAEALHFIQGRLASQAEDVRLQKMRAQCHAGLGQFAQQHLALAESFVLQGQTAAAIEQLQLAQRAADANFYEMSAIDARLRQMKLKRLEEIRESRN